MRRAAPFVALATSTALTCAAAAFIALAAKGRETARFERAALTTRDRIDARFETYGALLRATGALFQSQREIGPAAFHGFIDQIGMRARFPGLQGLGWATRLRRSETAAVEAQLDARFPGFHVWPDAGREERTAIVMLEPLDARNRAAIGYDMLTDPVRREAMERARDTGMPAMSGRVTLVQEIDQDTRQPGFLVYLPIFRGEGVPATIEGRREELIGYVYAPFRADDFFQGIFGHEAAPLVDFRVYDGPELDPARLLHERTLVTRGADLVVPLEVYGRRWTLAFAPLVQRNRDNLLVAALAVLAVGGALSIGLFLVLRAQERSRMDAEATAAELAAAERRAREEARRSDTLRRLGIALAAELELGRLGQLVTDEAMALTGADAGALLDADGALAAVAGTRSLAEQVARARSAVTRVLHGEGAVRGPAAGVASVLGVPVVSRTGETLGALFFAHHEPERFTPDHEKLAVALAGHAAIAMDNARLYTAIRESDRHKDEFLATLGHELRNPLSPILTSLEIVRRNPASAERQLAIVERQARHLARLVDDLLDVSRISKGKIELRKEPLSVRDALARAAETVQPMAEARAHTLQITPPSRPLLVEADPVRLEQILNNLLTNAIKYTHPGGRIEASAGERDGALELRVRDNGIGIPPGALRALFEPFVQMPGAKDYATGGLGIGLALVKGLVELHGGTVTAHSEGVGRGSEFVVRLPGPLGEGFTPAAGVMPVRRGGRHGRVLIVDDNVDAAETLAELFRMDGHEARVAHSGEGALQVAREFTPDLVLLDIGLPGMTGYEVLPQLRAMLKRARIVALTGFGQESDRRRALEAGFDEHVVKPVELERVQSLLHESLEALTH